MDSTGGSTGAPIDFSKLSETDKREMEQFIMNETQKARIQSSIHSLTDLCFKKCITSRISAGALDRSEEACTQNCVDRYMDANFAILKKLESMRM
ncbi:MAG: Mitochondrial import inner membrane translocase subunit tim8 [Bogoriella megaspora]|nr:MAG: Mitochondrial import inner membrane translocase subunit tim8 [Bogoriella megaspora]